MPDAQASAAAAEQDPAARIETVRRLLDRAWARLGEPNANFQETQAVCGHPKKREEEKENEKKKEGEEEEKEKKKKNKKEEETRSIIAGHAAPARLSATRARGKDKDACITETGLVLGPRSLFANEASAGRSHDSIFGWAP